jgi:DnaK suppressor protein
VDLNGDGPTIDTDFDADEGVDLGVLDAIETELADVERALVRLDDGTYGTCEECGRVFSDSELEDTPGSRLCPEHARSTGPTADA